MSGSFEHLVVSPGEVVILRLPPGLRLEELRRIEAALPAELKGRVLMLDHSVEVFVAPPSPCGCDFGYDSMEGTQFVVRRCEGCTVEH